MADVPFIKFFPGDFLGGTSGLTPAERGVYITILCLIWENDGPINMDDARLSRRCGMPKTAFIKAINALIGEGKLYRGDGGISNHRAEKTIMDRRNRVENATHAVNSRWGVQGEKSKQKQGDADTGEIPPYYAADTKPEARSQNIDGGGGGSACARDPDPPSDPPQTDRELILDAMGVGPDGVAGPSRFIGGQGDMAEANRWLAMPGMSIEIVLAEIQRVMLAKPDGPPATFRYFTPAMQRLSGHLSAEPLAPLAGHRARASPPGKDVDLDRIFAQLEAERQANEPS